MFVCNNDLVQPQGAQPQGNVNIILCATLRSENRTNGSPLLSTNILEIFSLHRHPHEQKFLPTCAPIFASKIPNNPGLQE